MSEIQEFYKEQHIFITGGTGFVGKILVEKLLRSCPEIETIYILIRTKKGKSIQERINEIASLAMFEPLRKINPDFEKKMVPLNGDVIKPGFGLSIEDRALLTNKVSIIIHAAATTRFDESLRTAVPINIISIIELIKICRECKKLKAAVYVSTAFSQSIHRNIEEKVYPIPMSYEHITTIVKIMEQRNFSEKEEFEFTKSLIGKFPNTYVFTKSIAEGVLNENAKDLPFCIFRFPITTATYREPVTGWVDTVQGFNQALMGVGIGAIHVLNGDLNANLHVVPADFVCNALIVSAWETGTFKKGTQDDVPVYNYVSGENNLLPWSTFKIYLEKCRPNFASNVAFYYPTAVFIKSIKLYYFCDFFLHLIPALLGDFILKVMGRKPMLHKIYKKGNKLLDAIRFFMLWHWTFETNRVQSMWNKLSKVDQELMPFDTSHLDWEEVIIGYWKGVLEYIMKDDMSPKGRKPAIRRHYVLYVIHLIVQVLFAIFIIWLTWKLFCGRSLRSLN